MNQALPLETRNRRSAGNRTPAIRDLNAERFDSTATLQARQARRLKHLLGCSITLAQTLAFLAYGEGRHD